MKPYLKTLPFVLLLAACGDGQPFFVQSAQEQLAEDNVVPGGDSGGNDEDDVNFDTTGGLPPGTADPTADGDIIRFENRDGNGSGLVTDITYSASNDRFTIDNLGFDGANVYRRDGAVPQLGGYAVYAADDFTPDSLTGTPIAQVAPYRAIYGTSNEIVDGEPRVSFAVVRTGGYVDYGFGGYIYQRSGGVTLPESGQAGFTGSYAGMRTFSGRGGMELTRGDIDVAIDFEDFNRNAAVRGRISNRELFTVDGTPIGINGPGQTVMPDVTFVVQEGGTSITRNGEVLGELNNTLLIDGQLEIYEAGTYSGVIAGDLTDRGDGGEMVGVVVLDSEDPLQDGVLVRETGGFIARR